MLHVCRWLNIVAIALLLGASSTSAQQLAGSAGQGRIAVRRPPPPATRLQPAAGLHTLSVDPERTAMLFVPASYRGERPVPVIVMLHGAGGNPRRVLGFVTALADSMGVMLLAPQSAGMTWDVIRGRYGVDVAFIERALGQVLSRYVIDTTRIAIGGFSDGATYALSLGITNGDLFTHVIAFSPGFMAPAAQRGEPKLFVSHGTQDQVLSIDACSRQIVRRVRDAGYDVVYREFEGGHTVPPGIAREAFAWLTGK